MYIDIGQYLFKIDTLPQSLQAKLELMYEDALIYNTSRPADFTVSLSFESMLRRYIRPQISFNFGSVQPFKPLPLAQVHPTFEWGINWVITASDYNHLIIHSAVLVKNGQAIIFPATPGSGKSTLAAYFALNGWQLYSDEMALIDLDTLEVKPLFRPVCLKNHSIDLIQQQFPNAIFTDKSIDTVKGDVAHLKTCTFKQFSHYKAVPIVAFVSPKYKQGHDTEAYIVDKIEGFSSLVSHAFNYNILGESGFDIISSLIENTQQYEITYSHLSEVEDIINKELIK